MKILAQNKDLDLNLDQTAWQGMRNQLEKDRVGNHWGDFSTQAMAMKLLNPNQELNINLTDWQGIKDELNGYRKSGRWGYFSEQAMAIKLLGPTQDLRVDQIDWQNMEDFLKMYRLWHVSDFFNHAMSMAILAAEEVKITDKGLEVNMRKPKKSLASEVPPMPETKQF